MGSIRVGLIWLMVLALAPFHLVGAQQAKKIPRIGLLSTLSAAALSDLHRGVSARFTRAWVCGGENILIEWRGAGLVSALAEELVRLKVDIIVTVGSGGTRAAKAVTSTIPIVMASDDDPVGNGFVASLARPGGNVTGLSTLAPEISGKRLEILKEVIPRLSRVAVFGSSTYPGFSQVLAETEIAAKMLKVKLQYQDMLERKDIDAAFRAATKNHVDAALIIAGAALIAYRTQIAELAIKNRLPATYFSAEFVDAGGLMSYGPNRSDLFRRAATYVDKILKGAKPADLPVEQPMKFEFIINLKAAKQIGLTIPPNVLARADKVIK
jgi:putative ABC transport system substrate-binding protein